MRKHVAATLLAASALAVVGAAQAQSTKGSGKYQATIVKFPVVNIQAKTAGFIQAKPVASLAGKAPTGGASTTLKLAKDIGDPLKPGFPAGEYVLQIETGVTPDADVGVSAFVTLTIDALGKCTAHAADSVNGDGTNDLCGGSGQPLCAPDGVGKCTFTVYQAAGIPNYLLGPGDGQPTAARFRLRQNNDVANCHTGDIILGGTPSPPTSNCGTNGPVVGVVGVANGDIDP